MVSSAYWPYPSGISEAVYYLAKNLVKRGHSIKILTTNYPSKWEVATNDDLDVVRFGHAILIPLNKSAATFPFGFDIPYRTKQLLSNERFDLIHLHGVYPPEIGFWALHFSKTVNCVTFYTAGFKSVSFLKPISYIFKSYLKKIAGKIAITKNAQIWAEPFFPGEYRIIPAGVDCERFSPDVPPIIKKDNNSLAILYLGRLDQRKGVLVAINGFRKIKDKFPTAKLLIVGKGPLEKTAKDLAKKLKLENDCHFFGYVKQKDLAGFYTSADVYIAPALGGEAQGIVLLEAMACGRPVIASDIDGYKEVIEDGKTGLFFKHGNADDLADTVQSVLTNAELRKSLMLNARPAAEKYSWDNIAKQTEDYYKEIIDIHPAPFDRMYDDK
jgi:phosphatidylinositol alpha-mannosyltransferase